MKSSWILNCWLMLAVLMLIVWLKPVRHGQEMVKQPFVSLPDDQQFYATITNKIDVVDYRQLRCMATAIYYESHNEPVMGQIAVARVVQNRVRSHFGDTPCDVVFQRSNGVCQFSWACSAYNLITARQCPTCWHIAVQVLAQNQYQVYMPKALYFHAGTERASNEKLVGHQLFRNR